MRNAIRLMVFPGILLVILQPAASQTLYRLPLDVNPGISAWFDHDPALGTRLRYDCGTAFAYDQHHGTDFAAVQGSRVVAAATGSPHYRTDGCPDDGSQPSCGGGYGNHVRLLHPLDGRVTIYAHLQNGTPTQNADQVVCGDEIGRSGNSGNSTGPHLHFELWQNVNIGSRLDFFGGDCSSAGHWVNQNSNSPTIQCQGTEPPVMFTQPPTILLSLTDSTKLEYRIGETVQLTMKTTAGVTSPVDATLPSVFVFLWTDTPNGRWFLVVNEGVLTETTTITPVSPAIPLMDYTTMLPPITVTPSATSGTYVWRASIHWNETFSASSLVAESAPVNYQVLQQRLIEPSVTAVRTSLALYRVDDAMVIFYGTLAGTRTSTYDLMLRLTSRATGNQYYFYDDSTDSNRWIHSAPKAMLTGTPGDGDFQIPSGSMPPIVIENSTPSGLYAMNLYFSEPGKNLPVGNSAQAEFTLETPTPEGSCFIATAAFGSPMAGSVATLRAFRDRFVLKHSIGQRLVRAYYQYSPRLSRSICRYAVARKAVRVALWPIIGFAVIALSANVWIAGLAFSLAVGVGIWIFCRGPRLARLVTLLAIIAGTAQAAEIRGNVVRSKPFPLPIPAAQVANEQTGKIVVTSPDGNFRIQGLSAGSYKLNTSATGFLTTSTQVSVSAADSVVKLVIAMAPVATRFYEYYLPHTAETGGWWTFISLLNPNYTAADVAAVAYDSQGAYLGVSSKISHLNINQQISGAPSDFFPAGVGSRAAWYKFTSTAPLAGFEVYGYASGALAGFPLTTADSDTLYLPHVAQDNIWWTGVSFVSAGVRSSEFRLEARDVIGTLLGASSDWFKVLGSGEKTVGFIDSYFAPSFPAGVQWATVSSDSPITGLELFGTWDFTTFAAVPVSSKGAKKFYFPHIATTGNWWTGVAMLNIDRQPGSLRMTAYGEDGAPLAVSRSVNLRPGERTVGMVHNFFETWPAKAKYLESSADVEIAGFELVACTSPSLLGGLAALPVGHYEIAYPLALSNSDWQTSLGFLNTATSPAKVTLQAMDSNGNRLAETKVTLGAKGYYFAALESLFGSVPAGASWARAYSDGAALVGFFELARVSTGQFADIPAVPIVPANMVGQAAGEATSGLWASQWHSLLNLVRQLEFEPVSGTGVRVSWPAEIDSQIEALTDGRIHSGDILVQIEDRAIRSPSDLWVACQSFSTRENFYILIRRDGGGFHTVRLQNALLGRVAIGR